MMNKRKITNAILSISLVALVVIGGTLAWLTSTATTKTNKFNVDDGEGLTAELLEDAFTLTQQNNAKILQPSQVIEKDPTIKNTSTLYDEWVGLKVVFVKGGTNIPLDDNEMIELNKVIQINWNLGTTGTTWQRETGFTGDPKPTEYYFHNGLVLKNNALSGALFTTVTIKSSATNAQLDYVKNTLGGFDIIIVGAAVQNTYDATQTVIHADVITDLKTKMLPL